MPSRSPAGGNALKTDLYELTMAAGYWQNKVNLTATFELFCHTMPRNRSYLVACGLQQAVDYILNLRFSAADIKYLKRLPVFRHVKPAFFNYLKRFRFTGDVWAVPEGETVFANEPILQVKAPIIEAQVMETYLLSVYHVQTMVASKAMRIVQAAHADGVARGVVDFGTRRAHGPEAGVLAARAAYVAGCIGTSNVHAARQFGVPVFGTMAHSWVEAFPKEEEAFEKYNDVFPQNTTLLIDTYNTLAGAEKLVNMKKKRSINAVRLDSGDLKALSKKVRHILDEAGLKGVKILASGNLNEYKIQELVREGSPIDAFGVGTEMVISRDEPALDLTYKLVETQSKSGKVTYTAKSSEGKETVPGRKQIFRQYTPKGDIARDIIGLFNEKRPSGARTLLEPVILKGRLKKKLPDADHIRKFARERFLQLPLELLIFDEPQALETQYSDKILALKKKVLG